MRSAVLRGREHPGIGRIACVAEEGAALALSQGGARKTYAHRDPNEDVAAYARGSGGWLLAVADGHAGHEASELAVEGLLSGIARAWTGLAAAPDDWESEARSGMQHAQQAVLRHAARGGNPHARTTLSFALLLPGADWLGWAAVGDSHLFRVDAGEVVELAPAGGADLVFLGSPSRTEAGELGVRSGSGRLGPARALVLATDGLSEHGIGVADPGAAVREAAEEAARGREALRPLALARGLAERANAAQRAQQAGDNIGVASFWIG